MIHLLVVFGTRPEAIKLCPLVLSASARPDQFRIQVCVTAQHRHLLDQVLRVFRVEPDHDLNLMAPGQSLLQSTSRILTALEGVFASGKPDIVLVQGDTTTTLCGALAAFYHRVPVGHVEAGLRTGDIYRPFPEEMNRLLAGRLATLHFASTEGAAENLRREGVAEGKIAVTGNTGIDALLRVARELDQGRLQGGDWPFLDPSKKLIVVTAHRRESFGTGMEQICRALAELAARPDVQVAFPVHPNPNVDGPVNRFLRGKPGIFLLAPMDYVPFVDLMRRAYLLITDSGGIQEEGPSLGKPVLVTRETTERPEAVAAGTVRLVGTEARAIATEAAALLDDAARHEAMCRVHNPYGDGRASARILDLILSFFNSNSLQKSAAAGSY